MERTSGNVAEEEKKKTVIEDLKDASEDERQAGQERAGQKEPGKGWGECCSGGAGNTGDTRSGQALVRCNHGRRVRLSGRHKIAPKTVPHAFGYFHLNNNHEVSHEYERPRRVRLQATR